MTVHRKRLNFQLTRLIYSPNIIVHAYTRGISFVSFQVFASYLAFCGIGLRNAQLYERSKLENRRNQVNKYLKKYFVYVLAYLCVRICERAFTQTPIRVYQLLVLHHMSPGTHITVCLFLEETR